MSSDTSPGADYAEPASLPPARRDASPQAPLRLWGGRGRTALKAACWGASFALAAALLVPLVDAPETGADSPEAAVSDLLHGLADLDAVAMLRVIDPDETGDRDRAAAAYDQLADRLTRTAEVPPSVVTDVLDAAEGQVGGFDSGALAALAAVDLDLDGLRLETEDVGGGPVRVLLRGGDLGVTVDSERVPAGVRDGNGLTGGSSYDMDLAQGWRRDGDPFEPYLVAVEVDGRWYVSLEATVSDLLTPGGGR